MSFTDIGTLTTRKADTLVYTQAEVNDIISRFSSNLVNFETDKNALTQRLEFLTKKETGLQLHSDTLIEYLKVKRIPRGLRLGIKPTLCKEDPAFCRNWDRILNKCSLDLMTLTVEGIQSKLSKLRIDISNIKQKLQSSYSDVNLDELDVKLRDTIDKHWIELLKVKLDKFRRDTVDYQEDRTEVQEENTEREEKERRVHRSRAPHGCPPGRKHDSCEYKQENTNGTGDVCIKQRFGETLEDDKLPSNEEEQDDVQELASTQDVPWYDTIKCRPRSNFFPPMTNHCVETFVQAVERDVNKLKWPIKRHKAQNLSRAEKDALHNLKSDTSITIKPADKGGAIVVMDTDYYREEAVSQLSNTSHYRLLEGDPTSNLKQVIDHALETSKEEGIITERLKKFLQVDFPIIPVFYLLPKIHKDMQRPPGRPIVAGMSSIFQPMAILLDSVLNPLVMDHRLRPWVADPPMMAYKRATNLRDQLVHALSEPPKKQDLIGHW
ncbi:uncharacterized protein LOC121397286 [Xenopus laevis]|uniref:Uncharacterized protein LOC121397286 n=1 Tax=Xenopus laevis TaxID=8355 RepID=A0A8J1LKN3_XENLA|nr:uncharacterized protein LOC121397286 [Xenopus laevis]